MNNNMNDNIQKLNELKERLDEISKYHNLNLCDINDKIKIITILMNSLYNRDRIYVLNQTKANIKLANNYLENIIKITKNDEFIIELNKYIKKGKYLITLRENVVYFIKRKYMTPISTLGFTYGMYMDPVNNYWFNAESQLKQICYENEIDVFNSSTTLEALSLYEYDEKNYYENDSTTLHAENCKNNVYFFIRRN